KGLKILNRAKRDLPVPSNWREFLDSPKVEAAAATAVESEAEGDDAAIAYLASLWPRKASYRHDLASALAGGMLRSRITLARVEQIILGAAKAAYDEEDRSGAISSTAARLRNRKSCSGWPTVRKLLGDEAVENFKDLLGLRKPKRSRSDPRRLSEMCLRERWAHADGWKLLSWTNVFHQWCGASHEEVPSYELDAYLTGMIQAEFDRFSIEAQKNKEKHVIANQVKGELVSNVMRHLRSLVTVPSSAKLPYWPNAPWTAHETLAAPNGLFHLPSLAQGIERKVPPTPACFTLTSLPFN